MSTPDGRLDASPEKDAPTIGSPGPIASEHDFGRILSHGQELRHVFRLANPTDREVRLLGAEAFSSCCSEIGPVPERIPPHGEVAIPIVYKAGRGTGRKGAKFVVETDLPGQPAWPLAVTVDLAAEVEIVTRGEAANSLPIGRPGSRSYTVVCRRLDGEGRAAPTTVEASPPLAAAFAGPIRESSRAGGLIEESRDFDVSIPSSSRPGPGEGTIRIGWPAGAPTVQAVYWRVEPSLRVSPDGIVLRATEGRRTVRVAVESTDGKPFRIKGATGPSVVEPPASTKVEATRISTLDLTLDPNIPGVAEASDIVIATDHSDQPTARLSVLVLPASEGARRP